MLDTTTVNYAINKVTSAWESVAPQIQNVSAEYVRFVVTKAVTGWIVFTIIGMIGVWALSRGLKQGKLSDNYDEAGPWIGLVVLGCVAVLFGGITFFTEGYQACLAIFCPEMYTIHEIIGAAK